MSLFWLKWHGFGWNDTVLAETVGLAKGTRAVVHLPVRPGMSGSAVYTLTPRFSQYPMGVFLAKSDIIGRGLVANG